MDSLRMNAGARRWAVPLAAAVLVAGTFAMQAPRLATAAATYSISGYVRDTSGNGIGGIVIWLTPQVNDEPTAVTDATGYYEQIVPPGDYELRTYDPNHRYPNTFYSASGTTLIREQATIVHAFTGPAIGISFVLPIGYQVFGTLSNANGPLVGFAVALGGPGGDGQFSWTDANGNYRVPVPPGTWIVNLKDPPAGTYAAGDAGNWSSDLGAATPIVVTDHDVGPFDMVLPGGDTVSGVVTDQNGPLAGIQVTASPAGGGASVGTTTHFDGTYTLAAASGTYTLAFHDPSGNHADGWYDSGAATGYASSQSAATTVDLTLGNAGNINIELPVTGSTPPGSTPTGSNVAVTPAYASGSSPASVTFASVSSAGTTSLTESSTAPPVPSGYEVVGSSPVYYDLTTSAAYSGLITVCFYYDGTTPIPTVLLHYDASTQTWDDVTASFDPINELLCGTTSSLSPFVLARKVGTIVSRVTVAATSAVGVTARGHFTTTTKVVRAGQPVTLRFALSPALNGALVSVWIAVHRPNGTWSAYRLRARRIADAKGLVFYVYRTSARGRLAFRASFAGDGTHAAAWSPGCEVVWR